MKDYLKTVAAYLTGWVIAQATYNRVIRHYKETTWDAEKDDIAMRVADELESRGEAPSMATAPASLAFDALAKLAEGHGAVELAHLNMPGGWHRVEMRLGGEDGPVVAGDAPTALSALYRATGSTPPMGVQT